MVWSAFDGYDYALQADYEAAWSRMADAFAALADGCGKARGGDDILVSVEWKPTDPSSRYSFLPSTAAVLTLAEQARGRRGRAAAGVAASAALLPLLHRCLLSQPSPPAPCSAHLTPRLTSSADASARATGPRPKPGPARLIPASASAPARRRAPRPPRAHLPPPETLLRRPKPGQVARPNFGLTLDTGHLKMAGENPAQSAAMVMAAGRLFGMHLNDGHSRIGADDGWAARFLCQAGAPGAGSLLPWACGAARPRAGAQDGCAKAWFFGRAFQGQPHHALCCALLIMRIGASTWGGGSY